MTISGFLRELPIGNIERRDTSITAETDKKVIDRIETMFKENRWSTVGSGRSADVVLLDIWDGAKTRPWVIKQETRRTREQELLGVTLEDELTLQEAAYRAVASAKERHPNEPVARIPKPLSILRDEKRAWLLMDFLQGDNLFVHTIRAHLLTYENDPEKKQKIASMDKHELVQMLLADTFINTLPPRLIEELSNGTKEEVNEQDWRMIALGINRITRGPSVVLNATQHAALKNTVDILHRAGIHHRDLHPGNIQMLPDGTVGIMDFGLAIKVKNEGTVPKGLYNIDVGHEFEDKKLQLLPDNMSIASFWDVARKIA